MSVQSIQDAVRALEVQAHMEWTEQRKLLKVVHGELKRVMDHFGAREAMEFAWSEHEVTSLAFLVEFDLFEQGESLGVFAV